MSETNLINPNYKFGANKDYQYEIYKLKGVKKYITITVVLIVVALGFIFYGAFNLDDPKINAISFVYAPIFAFAIICLMFFQVERGKSSVLRLNAKENDDLTLKVTEKIKEKYNIPGFEKLDSLETEAEGNIVEAVSAVSYYFDGDDEYDLEFWIEDNEVRLIEDEENSEEFVKSLLR